jgi:tetratricopeptide (TPR) repeat protein
MSRCPRAILILVALFCAMLSYAQLGGTSRAQFNTIHVQVRLKGAGAAPQGVMVLLENQDAGVVAQEQTDNTGKATFHPPNPGIYRVTVKHVGYEEGLQQADLKTSPTAFLIFELKPRPGADLTASSPIAPGALPANVNDKALKEFEEGQKAIQDNKIDDAIGHFKKAVDHDKKFAQGYAMLGVAQLGKKDINEAQKSFTTATQLNPKAALAHFELGAIYNQQHKWPDAERELKAGLAVDDSAAMGHYELAKTYWAQQNYDAAQPELEKTLKLKPDLAPAHVLFGNLMLRANNGIAAKHEYEEYLRLDPNGPMSVAAKDMLAKLKEAGVQ